MTRAVAMGFVLHVVEPHLNGPLGDMPALIRPAGAGTPTVVCGQGTAPAGATIAHYRGEGLEMIPGSGLLATVIPGAFDAWMLIARDHGTLPLRTLLEPAIHYAEAGVPVLARVAATIEGLADFFAEEWPTSAATWLPNGRPRCRARCLPTPPSRRPGGASSTRRRRGAVARRRSRRPATPCYCGFVAEAIDAWMREVCAMDAAGGRRKGVLTGDDMAGWRASFEAPLSVDYHGWTVWKPGVWSQGPTFLQTLRLLEGTDIAGCPPTGSTFVRLMQAFAIGR